MASRSRWPGITYGVVITAIGVAVALFAKVCIRMGVEFGWEAWIEQTLMPVVRETNPLIKESRDRWKTKWGVGADSQS